MKRRERLSGRQPMYLFSRVKTFTLRAEILRFKGWPISRLVRILSSPDLIMGMFRELPGISIKLWRKFSPSLLEVGEGLLFLQILRLLRFLMVMG